MFTLRAVQENGQNKYAIHIRVALNGERYPPFTVHRSPGDRSEAGPPPTCRAHTSGPLTHAC
eukprot:366442-Chlamydomonas_euryale.AAC.27